MTFRNAILNNKLSFTDNGAITYNSSGNSVLDLFFLFGSSRGKVIPDMVFENAYQHDANLTTRLSLWGRDIRGGAGEREQFRNFCRFLAVNHKDMAQKLILSGKINEVGRWDDYLTFLEFGQEYVPFVSEMIARGLSDPHTIGLCAKWMPRQGPVAYTLARAFSMSSRAWRKRLVMSTKVVEQQMCAKEWKEINFSFVPSVAASRYQKAFLRNAPEEYTAYKNSLIKGVPGVKINAQAVYPYDVIKSSYNGLSDIAEAQWEALPNYLDSNKKILALVDVSGSMTSPITGTKLTAMDISTSIGLYIALKQTGPFNRIVMNFSSKSEIILLRKKKLKELVTEIMGMNWGMSTNLINAFENLLVFAKKNNVSAEDMPEMILVISDMEFDRCTEGTNLDGIRKKYQKSGYEMPQLVFWNVKGRQNNVPATTNDPNIGLVSGFSPSIMKNLLRVKDFTPLGIMLNTLMDERYSF